MTISYISAGDYVPKPWKNGNGITDEICLLPAGASREKFDLRVSRATISGRSVFSAFPGVERTITLIEGAGLALEFDDKTVKLGIEQPYTFDSGLSPIGSAAGDAARVVNVMASRDTWRIAPASILKKETVLEPGLGGLNVIFALRGISTLSDSEKTVSLVEGDSALLSASSRLKPAQGAAVLVVPLKPTVTV